MSARATGSRTAGQPWLLPSRPRPFEICEFTYGAPCITIARSRARSLNTRSSMLRTEAFAHPSAANTSPPRLRVGVGDGPGIGASRGRRNLTGRPRLSGGQIQTNHQHSRQSQPLCRHTKRHLEQTQVSFVGCMGSAWPAEDSPPRRLLKNHTQRPAET